MNGEKSRKSSLRNAAAVAIRMPFVVFYLLILYALLYANAQFNPSRRLRRKVLTFCRNFFFYANSAILRRWFTRPIFICYDKRVLAAHKTISISNHCSDYDWFLLMILLKAFGKQSAFTLLMKKSLERVPLLGFALRGLGHIFLERDKSKDTNIIRRDIGKLKSHKEYNIVFYPEGTYPYPESVKRAKEFAQNSGLEIDGSPYIPELTLIPRKTGFNLIKDTLGKDYEGVMDVTVFMNPYVRFPSRECPPMDLLLHQKLTMNQCMLVNFYTREEVEKAGEDFLLRRFRKKEELLMRYVEAKGKVIETEAEYRQFVEKVVATEENDDASHGTELVYETIYVEGKYKEIIFAFPFVLLLMGLILAKVSVTETHLFGAVL